jgi:signal transduction histidine kinase
MTQPANAMRTNKGRPVDVPHDELLARLTANRSIGGAPREELEWLIAHGEVRRLDPGDVLGAPGDETHEMIVILTGHIAVYQNRLGARRKLAEWTAGDVSGVFPYSRLRKGSSDVVAEVPTEVFVLMRDQLLPLARECPGITEILVHAMIDRARMFNSTDWQDEKMMSLGKLSAGLAHELNNPASAASRAAASLSDAITQLAAASRVLEGARLNEDQLARVEAFRAACAADAARLSPIDRSDREEEVTDWLDTHAVDEASAEALVDAGVSTALLDQLADAVSGPALGAAIRWSAAYRSACSLSGDVQKATSRIYELVSAVKRFTYMDRAPVQEPFDLGAGLRDTVILMTAKAREKSTRVTIEIAEDVPRSPAYGAELNQVWSNLIDNALDAIENGGHVTVNARRERGEVIVSVTDDGAGVPDDVKARIFDPFFTTKPVGRGTGLGLDIARRVVEHHHGRIEFDSTKGRTEFRVILPAEAPAGSGGGGP